MLIRVIVAVLVFALLAWLGVRTLAILANPSEDVSEPETLDVAALDLRFRCPTCGAEVMMLRLSEENRRAKPPRHCRGEMEPVAGAEAEFPVIEAHTE